MNRSIKKLLSGVLIATFFVPLSPVMAVSKTCSFTLLDCYTESISANKDNHFIHITVSPKVEFAVRDIRNNNIVASGTAGDWGVSRTITGLYSEYRLHVLKAKTLSGGSGTISND